MPFAQDPAALAAEVAAATRRIRTLSADLVLTSDENGHHDRIAARIHLKRPNLARIEVLEPSLEVIVSDGKTLYTLFKNVNEYVSAPVAPDGGNIRLSFVQLIPLFFQAKLVGLLPGDIVPTDGGVETVNAVAYRILEIRTNEPACTLRYFVDPRNLVTRMTAELSADGQSTRLSAQLDRIRLDEPLPDRAFAFTPPRGATVRQGGAESKLLAVGARAPQFMVDGLSGGRVTLAQALRGKKALLVNFWFVGCTPCREEFPRLQKLHDTLKDRGLGMIAVNGIDSKPIVARYISRERFTFPVGVDRPGAAGTYSVARQYGVTTYPTSYLIAADGTILFRCIGYDEAGLRAALEKTGLK